jgi:hypothetical protein
MIKCKNCSREFEGKYCPDCGQNSKIDRITFKDIFSNVSNEIFSFDSKIITTLKSLFFQSGKASLDYLHGKRKKYLNPISYYFITISILIVVMRFFPYDYSKISSEMLKGTESDISALEFKLDSMKNSLNEKYDIEYDNIENFKDLAKNKDPEFSKRVLNIKQLDQVVLIQAEMPMLIVENFKFFNFLIFLWFPIFLRVFFSKKKYPFSMAELYTFTIFTAAQINLISAPFHIVNHYLTTSLYMFVFMIIPLVYAIESSHIFFNTKKIFATIKFLFAYLFTYLLFMFIVAASTMIYIRMMKL